MEFVLNDCQFLYRYWKMMMSLKPFLVFFYFLLFITTKVSAGWPEDGWVERASLNILHKGTPIKLDDIHLELAKSEKKISALLPAQTKTNVVLANFSVLSQGENGTPFHTFPINGPDQKRYAFQSGWASAFAKDLALEATEKALNPYASKIKTLTSEDKSSILNAFSKILENQKVFNQEIMSQFYFDTDSTSIEEILKRISLTFAHVGEGQPGSHVLKEFNQNQKVYKNAQQQLQSLKEETVKGLQELTATLQSYYS